MLRFSADGIFVGGHERYVAHVGRVGRLRWVWELVDTERRDARWQGTARTRRAACRAVTTARRQLEHLDRLDVERAVVALSQRPSTDLLPAGLVRRAVGGRRR